VKAACGLARQMLSRKRLTGMSTSEPRNPFYLLLLLASVLFVVTALAYGLVPVLEEKAAEAGNPPPPSAFRDALRADGWKWLLVELAAMAVLSALSMGLDRLRSLQKERADGTISPAQGESRVPPSP
jgi:hypothetical protein